MKWLYLSFILYIIFTKELKPDDTRSFPVFENLEIALKENINKRASCNSHERLPVPSNP
jgi:hypothetical protein